MRILLTGAGGQIGRDLAATFASEGHEVIATDLRPGVARDGYRTAALDVTSADAVETCVAEYHPDKLFHLAAILSARGELDPQLTYAVNQTGTYNVLEACRIHGVGQVIFTSSIAVYGPGLPDPTPDDVPLHPTTMYGVTKASGELLCEYYRRKFNLDVRGVRFPGLISATQPGGGSSDYALFMYVDGVRVGHYQAFCRDNTRIPLMYMKDGVRALSELSAAPREGLSRCVYNVAAFSPTAAEIAASVRAALPEVEISFESDPRRQAILDSWPNALDDTAARTDFGWRAEYDLDAMTADLIPRVRAMLASGEIVISH